MRAGVFVQVRLGSTRLARKALLPLPGGNVIQHVMRALSRVPADVRALLTDAESRETLLPYAKEEGFMVVPGPDQDVLARYCMACRRYDVSLIVRATGDNPLTSAILAREIIALHENKDADLSHYLGNPWGTGVEVVQAAALFEAEKESSMPEEREHITTWIYRHSEGFTILEPQAPRHAWLPDARVTVDTPEDYARVKLIFDSLYTGEPIEAEEVVAWLRAHGTNPRKERGAREARDA